MLIPIETLDFYRETGIMALYDILQLDLMPCEPDGAFYNAKVSKLLEFCNQNPSFHIISTNRREPMYNKYIENSDFYFLADGNPDPRLIENRDVNAMPDLRRNPDGTLSVYFNDKKIGQCT